MGLFDAINKGMNFLAPERERAQLQNKALREGLLASKRQRQGIDTLRGLLGGPPEIGPPMSPEMRQRRTMQAAMDIAPGAVAQSLLAPKQSERSTSMIKEMERYGYPMTPEGVRQFNEDTSGGMNPQDVRAMLEIENIKEERARAAQDRTAASNALADNYQNTINRIGSLLEANAQLEGTMLETGRSLPDWRRAIVSGGADLIEMLGGDATKQREALTAYNTFEKDAAGFLMDQLDTIGGATNMQFEGLRKSIANVGADPQTNRRVLKNYLLESLQAIDRTPGLRDKVPDSAKQAAYDMIQKINDTEQQFQMRMMLPGVENLEQLSPEERQELMKRLGELQRGR